MNDSEILLEKLAEEIEPHIEKVANFLGNLNTTKKPLSIFSTTSFIPKIESIRIGIFALAEIEEQYSVCILFRSIIEQFIKFQYLWMKTVENGNDDIGIDFCLFCRDQERIDYAKALTKSYKLMGLPPIETPLETLKRLGILANESSASQIKKKVEQFNYKEMTFYIAEKIRKGESLPILTAVFPRYSELSSYVHGGPSVFSNSPEMDQIKEAVDFSTFASIYTRWLSWILMAQFDKSLFPLCSIVKKHLDEYLQSHS